MDRKVAFVSFGLSNPEEKINSLLTEDEFLSLAIKWYSNKIFEEDNIETFKQTKNMIITETGYKVAVFSNKQPNPVMN